MIGPQLLPYIVLLLFSSSLSLSLRQLPLSNALYSLSSTGSSSIAPVPMVATPEAIPPQPPRSSSGKVMKAFYAISAVVVVLTVVSLLFLFRKKLIARCTKRGRLESSFRREEVVVPEEFKKCSRKIKGVVVDENGTDVIYMTNLEDGQQKTDFPKVIYNPSFEVDMEEEKRIDIAAPGRVKRSKQEQEQMLHLPFEANSCEKVVSDLQKNVKLQISEASESPAPVPPPPPPTPTERLSASSPTPPPPPPPPPPRPVMPAKKNPPPKAAVGFTSPLKPPTGPKSAANNRIRAGTSTESWKETGFARLKLKPLHWDKIIANNAEHSLVWDQIKDGSLRFDDELIETLFGYTPVNGQKPEKNIISSNTTRSNLNAAQVIFILEPRKSQNIAIVLKSLAISRKEIVDALQEGQGLSADTLEKLIKIAPTVEEQATILQFKGNTTKLAVAETFLYHVLKAVPSAFSRLNAMLFRQNYDSEILLFKESIQTLESACKELRNRGLFFKLLEAILKAGNRMNAGTSRGDARGFNLSALQKLSDVKSTDGRTTLLHFVVEQVARSEGRRLLTNKNGNPNSLKGEDNDTEYLMTGLRVMGALRAELSSVKTAATIEYNHLSNTCPYLKSRVSEIRELLPGGGNGEGSDFESQLKVFLEECEEELKVVVEDQTRVMELVRRTTEYYQAGTCKDRGTNPLQIFVIVKDFLNIVERVQADITKKLQRKNGGSSSPPSPLKRSDSSMKLTNFRSQFLSDISETSSGESEDDF